MTTTTQPIMLTGQSLVDFVNDKMELVNRQELSRTEMIKDAGYVYDNGKAMYTQFYTELLKAKGEHYVTDSEAEDQSYETLHQEKQRLFDVVDDRFGQKWDFEQMLDFLSELDDIGIDTVEKFEDDFYGVYDTEAEFAEEYYDSIGQMDSDHPLYSFINWQDVYDCNLKYDFDCIEFDYTCFFFHN